MKALWLAVPALVAVIISACSLKADHCITMSDCDDGFTCNEGLCQVAPPDNSTLSDPDADVSTIEGGSAITYDAGTTAVDAADAADASDAGDADADSDADASGG